MRKSQVGVWTFSLCLIWTTGSALRAQDTADTNKSDTAKRTDTLTELAALEKARADLIAAKLAPLTAVAGDGKVTLGDNAGSTEAWLLAGDAVGVAASKIAKQFPTGNFIVLAGDETFSFKPLAAFVIEETSTSQQLSDAVAAGPKSCGGAGTTIKVLPLIPLIGSLASALRTDTEVRSVAVDAKDRLLANTLAGKLTGRAYLPSALTAPSAKDSDVLKQLAALDTTQDRAAAAKACIAAIKKPSEDEKASGARIDAALTRSKAFETALGTSDASGAPPLANILALEKLKQNEVSVIRVYIDRAGGSLITRRNLWTALGAPAIGVSGGLVASYQSANPESGLAGSSGAVRCVTRLTGMRSVQANGETKARCFELGAAQ